MAACFFFSTSALAQKPEEIVSPIVMEYDSLYYATQAQAWKKEIQKNPQNEKAWENYYKASKYQYTWYFVKKPQWDKLDEILKEMKEAIPGTFFYNLMQYMEQFNPDHKSYMRKALAMRPDDLRYYPDYVAFLIHSGDEEELRKYCKKWYESGSYSANLLSYNYNEMAGTEPEAIIFSNGDASVYPKFLLQYGKGLFSDKKVICMSFLSFREYTRKLTQELQIPDFTPETGETSQSGLIDAFIRHVIRHSKRPVYRSMNAGGTSLKNQFYSEGLIMKYAERPYDNLAVTKQNFEKVFLKDYLKVGFVPETYETSAQMLNLSYIPCLHSLLRFYKDSGDQVHFQELYQLMNTILTQCTIKGERWENARKIFQEFRK